MDESWTYLIRRYGGEDASPSPEQIAEAAQELFCEDLPGMTEADYAAHPEASLRFGFDGGPMYVLVVNRHGGAVLEVWSDTDYENEAKSPRKLASVTQAQTTDLWRSLANGDLSNVEGVFDADA
jgi:hypothetical protein